MQKESFLGSAGPLELQPVPEIPNTLGLERASQLGTALPTVPEKKFILNTAFSLRVLFNPGASSGVADAE